jgi:hypothetical protein
VGVGSQGSGIPSGYRLSAIGSWADTAVCPDKSNAGELAHCRERAHIQGLATWISASAYRVLGRNFGDR